MQDGTYPNHKTKISPLMRGEVTKGSFFPPSHFPVPKNHWRELSPRFCLFTRTEFSMWISKNGEITLPGAISTWGKWLMVKQKPFLSSQMFSKLKRVLLYFLKAIPCIHCGEPKLGPSSLKRLCVVWPIVFHSLKCLSSVVLRLSSHCSPLTLQKCCS